MCGGMVEGLGACASWIWGEHHDVRTHLLSPLSRSHAHTLTQFHTHLLMHTLVQSNHAPREPLFSVPLSHTHSLSLTHTPGKCATFESSHCNTLQHIAAHCCILKHIAAHCSTLQHTATHRNTLQDIAAHCNTHGSCGAPFEPSPSLSWSGKKVIFVFGCSFLSFTAWCPCMFMCVCMSVCAFECV